MYAPLFKKKATVGHSTPPWQAFVTDLKDAVMSVSLHSDD